MNLPTWILSLQTVIEHCVRQRKGRGVDVLCSANSLDPQEMFCKQKGYLEEELDYRKQALDQAYMVRVCLSVLPSGCVAGRLPVCLSVCWCTQFSLFTLTANPGAGGNTVQFAAAGQGGGSCTFAIVCARRHTHTRWFAVIFFLFLKQKKYCIMIKSIIFIILFYRLCSCKDKGK